MPLFTPLHFISAAIQPLYDTPPVLEKNPGCPNGFVWQGETYQIIRCLREWRDFTRRGRMARNMRPTNQRKAIRRGSVGVGRFYFRVEVQDGRLFDLYYDRAVKNADDRKGHWILQQEVCTTEKD